MPVRSRGIWSSLISRLDPPQPVNPVEHLLGLDEPLVASSLAMLGMAVRVKTPSKLLANALQDERRAIAVETDPPVERVWLLRSGTKLLASNSEADD